LTIQKFKINGGLNVTFSAGSIGIDTVRTPFEQQNYRRIGGAFTMGLDYYGSQISRVVGTIVRLI
jgi:hypothetical protein